MKIGSLDEPLARTCHPCQHLHGDLSPGDSAVLASSVTRLPASREQVRMMVGRALAEAAGRRASPYLVAHVARSVTRLVVVVTSHLDEQGGQ
jgi:hypothetical protein